MLKTLILLFLIVVAATPALAQQRAVKVKQNLDAAEKSIKSGDYEDALLSIEAALAISPHVQRAHALAFSAYAKMKDKKLALHSAIKAFDATKIRDKKSSKTTKKMLKYIRSQRPYLGTFLDLRSQTLKSILKHHKTATKAKDSADADWIIQVGQSVYPTHIDLERVTGPGVPRSHEIRVVRGLSNLLKSEEDWIYYNTTASSGIKDGVMTITPDENNRQADVGYKPALLKEDFTFSFKIKYTKRNGENDHHFSIFLSKGMTVPEVTNLWAIAIDAIKTNRVLFFHSRPDKNEGWKIQGAEKLKAGLFKESVWTEMSVKYDSASRGLSLDIAGERVGDITISKEQPLDLRLRFGLGGMLSVEIKDLYATLEKPKTKDSDGDE